MTTVILRRCKLCIQSFKSKSEDGFRKPKHVPLNVHAIKLC